MSDQQPTQSKQLTAPDLMLVCARLGILIKKSPKEVWKMMDVQLSYLCNQPKINLDKLDEFLYQGIPWDREISTMELVKEKFGDEAVEFIKTLL